MKMSEKQVWYCKIGGADESDLPWGADSPMREAVKIAYKQLTGKEPDFCFTGWGAELTDAEQTCVDMMKREST